MNYPLNSGNNANILFSRVTNVFVGGLSYSEERSLCKITIDFTFHKG